jgi:tight adherence protein C
MNGIADQLVIVAVGIAGGLSIGMVAWTASRVLADVPEEDRTYRDRPPMLFRVMWWPIQWLSYYGGGLLSIGYRQRLLSKLRLAGLDYTVSPEQLVAQRLLFSVVFGLLLWWITDSFNMVQPTLFLFVGLAFGQIYATSWFRDRVQSRRRDLLKSLPFFLDLITLCVEAGLNLTGAIQQAVQKGPAGPLREELARVLRDVRAGKPRADALRTFSDRMDEPAIANLVAAMIQAESMGMNLGPILRAQADQRRTERFSRAEKLAMEAPVKLLLPLIAFIFPCTFLVLGFPIAMKFMQMGM